MVYIDRIQGDETVTHAGLKFELMVGIPSTWISEDCSSGRPWRRLPDWTIAVAFLVAVLVAGLWLVAGGMNLTHEDGFYYFKIAQHVASGHGSTFDGRHLTNGYHPLWLLLLVPLFWLAPSADDALTAGVLVQVVLSAAVVSLVYCTARLLMGRVGAVLAAQLWLVFTASVTLGGQEFAVQSVGVLATAHLYLRARPDVRSAPVATYGTLGLLLALTALARLETIALAVIVGAWLAWPWVRRGSTRQHAARLAAFGLPVLLVVIAYVVANLTLFGYLVPVSAAVKREWSAALLVADPWFQSDGWLAAKARHLLWPLTKSDRLSTLYLALGIPVIAGLWGLRWIAPRAIAPGAVHRLLTATSPFVTYGLALAGCYTLLYHGSLSYPPHYYVVQPWLAALLVGAIADDVTHRLADGTRRAWGLTLSVVAVLIVPAGAAFEVRAWQAEQRHGGTVAPLHDAARWVSQHVPPDSVVGSWNAGAIGFLSGREVVNLDGLVNSWDYFRRDRHDLCRYWDEAGISYIVDIFDGTQPVTPAPTTWSFGDCADRMQPLLVDDRYQASWRIEAYFVDGGDPGP